MSKFALINIAHTERNPKFSRAAFRILGFFDTEAAAHAFVSNQEEVDIFLVPCSKWIMLAKSNEADQESLLNALGTRYQNKLQSHEEEFAANVHDKKTGEANKRASITLEHIRDSPNMSPVAPVDRSRELRMQRFAILSIINDESSNDLSEQQPAIILWDCTETESEARSLIKDKLAGSIKDVNLDVVAMYEWASVPTFDEIQQIDEMWRDPKLDDIMQSKKMQSQRVKDYEAECRREGRTPACIEIANCKETDNLPIAPIPCDPPCIEDTALIENGKASDGVLCIDENDSQSLSNQ